MFSYFIFDIDGITLVNYGEESTNWKMCNLEGEEISRYIELED